MSTICAPRPPRLLLLVFALLVPSACMKPNPLVAQLEAAEGESGDEGSEDGEETQGDEDGEDTQGEPASESGEADTDPAQMLPDLGSEACSAPLSVSPSCGECLADACCEQVLACEDSADCLCLSECVASGSSIGSCQSECDAKLKEVPAFEDLAQCSDETCAASCPL